MLTVACWNVLADVHVLPSRYSGVASALLDTNQRRRAVAALVDELARGADVIALQEVDEALVPALEQTQLHVRHLLRPGVPEGVALVSRQQGPAEVETGVSRDGRRVWLGGRFEDFVVVSVHLDVAEPAQGSSRSRGNQALAAPSPRCQMPDCTHAACGWRAGEFQVPSFGRLS